MLHWSMAVLVLVQGCLGWVVESMDRSPLKVDLMTAHKSLGMTLLMLALFRLAWHLLDPRPLPVRSLDPWQDRAARWTHRALYLMLIVVPLSGWLAASAAVYPWKLWWLIDWPRLIEPNHTVREWASLAHEWLVWLLLALLLLHVLAAMKHHLVDRDETLRRMWSGR